MGPTGNGNGTAVTELLLGVVAELLDLAELLLGVVAELLDLTEELLDLEELLNLAELLLDAVAELLKLTALLLDSIAELLKSIVPLLDTTAELLLLESSLCDGLTSELELDGCRKSKPLKLVPPEVQAKNENMDARATKKSNIFGKYVRIFIPPE